MAAPSLSGVVGLPLTAPGNISPTIPQGVVPSGLTPITGPSTGVIGGYGMLPYGGVVSTSQNVYLDGVPSPSTFGQPTVVAPTKIRIREYPPLRLSVNVATPSGYESRWSSLESDGTKGVSGLTCSTTMPGGFEHADMTLIRDPRRNYPDLEQLEKLTVRGLGGGTVAWQGRLETIPSVSGNQISITPGAVGYQGHLGDNNSMRELFVHVDLTQWEAASVARKKQLAQLSIDLDDATARNEPSGTPAIDCELSGPWSREHFSEGWFDAKGLPIGKLMYRWEQGLDANGSPTLNPADSNWSWQAGLSSDDVATAWNGSGNLRGAGPGSGSVSPVPNQASPWAFVQLDYKVAQTNQIIYDIYFTALWLYGTQNLPLYTTVDNTQGVLGSDVLRYAVPRYAPKLATTFAGQPTIYPSSFVIPQLSYLNPVTVAQLVQDVTSYELQDWAVWEGPTFWWYPRYSIGKKWRARVTPTSLQQAGPQIDRLWNGVIVQFTDVYGVQRSVGPPGGPAQYSDPRLIDYDPQSPLNQAGIRKWASLQMTGTATVGMAVQTGSVFLAEQKVRNTSGSAVLNGYVEDDKGVIWPAWMVRAGDRIAFVDAADPSYRRIVSTSYSDDSKTNSITLDTPPDTMQAILARLNVLLAPIVGGG